MLFRLTLLGTLALVVSCVTTLRYHVSEPGEGWKPLRVKGIDRAWLSKDKATLMVNSSCQETSDASLLALTKHLLIGMTEQKVLDQKTVPSSEREGLQTTVSAKIDGVPRNMKIFVLKKDSCVYDIVLASPEAIFDSASATFDSLRDSFRAGQST